MPSYRFLTTWLLRAPRQEVWDVLADCERWPEWWPGADTVEELDPGDPRRVGSAYRVGWRAPVIPYRVRFDFHVDAVDEPRSMAGRARGALSGSGVWRLFEDDGVCAVTFDWEVHTTEPLAGALAFALRPVVVRSHGELMRRGGRSLARRMGTELLAAS